eukprot:TRINITY_DN61134_c0_g1_i1.p1 TRINITY_DN61134_c0_g1~~TRINITY_DN61134_c0_g1_i1.p1  ORF type:complete len:563 (-),score=95.11 TRINITY_DN61134_c0_g1_i1:32-1720(-)
MAPAPSDESILQLSVRDLAQSIACGSISAVQALAAYRRRAEAIDAACNCLTCYVEKATVWAEEADAHLQATGKVLGPLHGVPCSIKDHFALAGYPVTMGVKKLRERQEKKPIDKTSTLAQALRKAGAVPFCKTTMTQLGETWGGGSPAYGDTLNPWNTMRTTGGSSCGEGALVGAGGSAFGIGSDVGGSVRIPASFCGICALKPTALRLTFNWDDGQTVLNHAGDYGVMASPGPMARRVEDLVEICGALWDTAYFKMDPRVPPIPFNRPVVEGREPLRIGWYTTEYMYPRPCAAVVRAVEEGRAALEAAGHELVAFRPNSACSLADIMGCDVALQNLESVKGEKPDEGGALVGAPPKAPSLKAEASHPDHWSSHAAQALFAKAGTKTVSYNRLPPTNSAKRYQEALAKRDALRDQFAKYWNDLRLDAVLCPVFPFPAPPVEEVRKGSNRYIHTRIYNFLDYPAGVVPATTVTAEDLQSPYDPDTDDRPLAEMANAAVSNSLGLPVAVQLVAQPWREELCLRAMLEVQRSLGFDVLQHAKLKPIPRRPPVLGERPVDAPSAKL